MTWVCTHIMTPMTQSGPVWVNNVFLGWSPMPDSLRELCCKVDCRLFCLRFLQKTHPCHRVVTLRMFPRVIVVESNAPDLLIYYKCSNSSISGFSSSNSNSWNSSISCCSSCCCSKYCSRRKRRRSSSSSDKLIVDLPICTNDAEFLHSAMMNVTGL